IAHGTRMPASTSHLRSRAATFIGLLLLHVLVVYSIWRIQPVRVPEEAEVFTTQLSWIPAASPTRPSAGQRAASTTRGRAKRPREAPALQPSQDTSITLPVVPRATTDWSNLLSGAAAATLEKAQREASQLNRVRRTPQGTEPWLEAPAVPSFRW